MSLNEVCETSAEKSTINEKTSEMKTILELIKSIEARQAADDAIQNKMIHSSHQELYASFLEQSRRIYSLNENLRPHGKTIAEQDRYIKEQEDHITALERRISSQEQRILTLEALQERGILTPEERLFPPSRTNRTGSKSGKRPKA